MVIRSAIVVFRLTIHVTSLYKTNRVIALCTAMFVESKIHVYHRLTATTVCT